jgi:2Fe-2S ferredoxin
MPSVTFIQPDDARETIDIPAGGNVMQGACDAGIRGIPGECGGNALCATCHVFVAEEFRALLPPMDENENDLLDGTAAPRQPESRLSCRIVMRAELDGLVVRIPRRQT